MERSVKPVKLYKQDLICLSNVSLKKNYLQTTTTASTTTQLSSHVCSKYHEDSASLISPVTLDLPWGVLVVKR